MKAQRLLPLLFSSFSYLLLPAQNQEEVSSTDKLKKLSIEELLEQEVSSVSKREEKLSETASSIQVLTSEDIRRSGATCIPEALRWVANLHVAQKNSHDWAISARGFNTDLANKLLVLIDGRTVYTPLFSGVFWDRQDYLLEDIDRIEVISGPGSTLWGSNAVNGVINIITKKASETKGFYVEAGGGTQLRGFAGLRYGGTIGTNGSFRVYGKYTDRDDAVFPNGEDASDAWNIGQAGFRIDTRFSEKDQFTFQGDFYNEEVGLSTGGETDVYGGNLLSRWTRSFSEHSSLRVQLYYDHTYFNQPVPESTNENGSLVFSPAGKLKDDLDTYDFELQHNFNLGNRNSIVWGLGYRRTHDEVKNAPGLAFSPDVLDRDLFNVFIQDEIKVIDKLFLTLGTKVEHNDYTGFEYSPSTRLQWNLTTKQTLWAAVSRAVRIPSRIDRHVRIPTPGLSFLGIDNLLVGGENFKSETVIAYELGYRSQIGSKVSGSLSSFYNVYDRIRSTSESPPDMFGFTFPFYYENNLEAETYGLELNITWQALNWWRLRGGYSLLEEDVRIKEDKEDFNNSLNETADPQNRFMLRSSMNLPGNLEFDMSFRWIDAFQFNSSGVADTVSAYSELDIRLAWQPTRSIEISITGQNLLSNHHAEYVISNPNPRAEIERSVYGKVIWHFVNN
ncbi:MAG TPA: TonB-dependent receptor [Cyclobacteriaceae bacterium]|nr:TonB-dependent receptor [Cyclobacteriaceae bacterium]